MFSPDNAGHLEAAATATPAGPGAGELLPGGHPTLPAGASAPSRIALQLPDELLPRSAELVAAVRDAVPDAASVFLLADTSYGSCCVDEVAAEHMEADLVVHYGNSCLSRTTRLPCLYVFTARPLDVGQCADAVAAAVDPAEHPRLAVVYTGDYAHAVGDVVRRLAPRYEHVVAASAVQYWDPRGSDKVSARLVNGLSLDLAEGRTLDDYALLHIGEEDLALSSLVMTMGASRTVFSFIPSLGECRLESAAVNRVLMKRFYLVERAKDAQTIGILLGTLGVSSYLHIVKRLQSLIRDSGRSYYTFVVGKVNPPKLANFMEVDLFVIVACPQNSIIESKEFIKPVVTPFELELALSPSQREWQGRVETSFEAILETPLEKPSDEDLAADVSLVSGKVRSHVRVEYDATNQDEAAADGTLVRISQERSLAKIGSAAASHLATRSYQGLAPDDDVPVQLAQQGTTGVAMGYEREPGVRADGADGAKK